MPISSQAMNENNNIEGSETISQESRVQVNSKRPAPNNWGDDIVHSSWKREAALKTLVKKLKISDKGCWEWQGSKTIGYGTVKIPEIYGDFKILVHRLSVVAFKGEAIKGGLFVCHHCDNPKCFNPDHLFLGTQKQNLEDCSSKGRTMTGSRNGNSKYSSDDIEEVKALLSKGKTGVEISKLTGMSRTHISRIRKGYTWAHVTKTDEELVHANRKYSDEQIEKVAYLLTNRTDAGMSNSEIAEIAGVNRYLVLDMNRGKAHQRFMKRATE
ncbi:MAG: HNH endonuclease [Desulfobulbaceae bacterium]|nr:HNH endonuclease [Desulfobulbaceae bacterium]